mmetsp:Transcript_143627/g.459534  ORF Transcript_143627/g.459534 Transcript_143627/m.459534 type:complete len:692 (+) Transcript_143627:133-2208(+)
MVKDSMRYVNAGVASLWGIALFVTASWMFVRAELRTFVGVQCPSGLADTRASSALLSNPILSTIASTSIFSSRDKVPFVGGFRLGMTRVPWTTVRHRRTVWPWRHSSASPVVSESLFFNINVPASDLVWALVTTLVSIVAGKLLLHLRRRLHRPYQCEASISSRDPQHLEREMCKAITYIQDAVIRPIDKIFPGSPYIVDLQSFPFTPTVLIIGNHSCGKSTFINGLLGKPVQATGVAPTDDGFTILERASQNASQDVVVEDGPTILGCPRNRPFRDLQRFGDAFLGHFRRKIIKLPDDAAMPHGIQIVDSPGMIDTPGHPNGVKGRGYDFVQVVRWWAKRADVILIMFDPDKPGTTGESLDVLTQSLADLEYKFRIVLGKVDQLDSTVDFARAYGTLGWSLSKVIQRKDIPLIYTICNEGFEGAAGIGKPALPLHDFAASRCEVVTEVFRAKARHYDNAVTTLERTLREVEMIATVLRIVCLKARRRLAAASFGILSVLSALGVAAGWLWRNVPSLHPGWLAAFPLASICLMLVMRAFMRQSRLVLRSADSLDSIFKKDYAEFFIHDEGEDLRARWALVRPKIMTILAAARSVVGMSIAARWRIGRVKECLRTDIWYLRQLARMHRLSSSSGAGEETADQTVEGVISLEEGAAAVDPGCRVGGIAVAPSIAVAAPFAAAVAAAADDVAGT